MDDITTKGWLTTWFTWSIDPDKCLWIERCPPGHLVAPKFFRIFFYRGGAYGLGYREAFLESLFKYIMISASRTSFKVQWNAYFTADDQ